MTTIPKDKLNKLKKQLKGRLNEVAKEANVSLSTVSRVLDGKATNPESITEVIKKCIEIRDRVFQSNQQLADRI